MSRWHSSTGKVVILGDSAHAVPPPAGQGANQALEDGYSFGILLANLNSNNLSNCMSLSDALTAWEAYRMERMEKVLELTNRVLTIRMTDEERANVSEHMRWDEIDGSDAGKSELGWLYLVDIDSDIKSVIETLHT
ncbi:Monooxygenase FAD-binding [Penicillium angulare]|uniref:Monooxygenase FAD-binding n=1 Tax=Penicillium angulare TaxID=116970 RepID=UPI002540CADB|nr:Monooxygenase FAD-binding [Penicillium angulare]KAJ5290755.1 Monooxygenase FAD-binding [Penicillium angulare]